MKEELIKKEYKKKIKLLIDYNKSYYNDNKSIITDDKYDVLKKEILFLENKYKFLNHKNSPSHIIGHKPSRIFKKVSHKAPMLSLGNAFTEKDLMNFQKKIINFLNDNKLTEVEYSAEPKIDGISASLIYKNGILTQGLSRGDGKEGEDITE
jgi:DNA ligase (NAD+)